MFWLLWISSSLALLGDVHHAAEIWTPTIGLSVVNSLPANAPHAYTLIVDVLDFRSILTGPLGYRIVGVPVVLFVIQNVGIPAPIKAPE